MQLRDELGLAERVEFMGARDSDEVVAALTGADAFVLTPTSTEDGDRDGIPNVLVEAMACGLPVVTTTAGGITELVDHDVNGLLCDPEDVDGDRRLDRRGASRTPSCAAVWAPPAAARSRRTTT